MSRALWRQRVTFWLGGLAVGVAAIVFAKAADLAYSILRAGVARAPLLPLLVTPLGFAAIVLHHAPLLRRLAGQRHPAGDRRAAPARSRARAAAWSRCASRSARWGSPLLGLLVGAAVGREGPTVQVGAAVMHEAGRFSPAQLAAA